jgi:hypothetical protein
MASFEGEEQTAADVEALVEQFKNSSGIVDPKVEFIKSPESGLCVVAKEEVTAGSIVISVPYEQLLTVNRVKNFEPLRQIFVEQEQLNDFPDEVLAIGIMFAAIAGEVAPWYQHVVTFPVEGISSTIHWRPEELEELKGSNVYHLTRMMNKQIEADWEAVHSALKQLYPHVLGGVTLSIYKWAMSMIYSRAVGIHNQKGEYERVIPPVLDFVNHNPVEANETADAFNFDTETNMLNYKVAKTKAAGEECFAVYGPYSNAKLAYNYGFIIPQNNHRGIDLWTKPGPQTSNADVKQQLLSENELTRDQKYDFEGTIKPGYIAPALLSTLRICNASPEELQSADQIYKVFRGSMMNVRNEDAAYSSLLELLQANFNQEKLAEDKLQLHDLLLANKSTGDRRVMALFIRIDEQELYKETIEMVQGLRTKLNAELEAYTPPDGVDVN